MKHLVSFEQITPEMAKQLLVYNTNNRQPSPRQVVYLAEEMRRERFMPTTVIHIAYDMDGNAIVINGQQTLMAIVKANKTIALTVQRTTDCTQEDREMLYMHTDIPRRRSFGDTAVAYHLSDKMHLRSRTVNKIASALRFMWNGFGIVSTGQAGLKLPDAILFEHVPRWEDEARLLSHAISGCASVTRGLIEKAPVYSVALITAFYQPDRAKEFWSQVALNDGLRIGDPRKELHEYLPTTKRTPGSQGIASYKIARGVAKCWNAFYEGREISKVYVKKEYEKSPIVIKGTLYSGNQGTEYYPHRDPNHNGDSGKQLQSAKIRGEETQRHGP